MLTWLIFHLFMVIYLTKIDDSFISIRFFDLEIFSIHCPISNNSLGSFWFRMVLVGHVLLIVWPRSLLSFS